MFSCGMFYKCIPGSVTLLAQISSCWQWTWENSLTWRTQFTQKQLDRNSSEVHVGYVKLLLLLTFCFMNSLQQITLKVGCETNDFENYTGKIWSQFNKCIFWLAAITAATALKATITDKVTPPHGRAVCVPCQNVEDELGRRLTGVQDLNEKVGTVVEDIIIACVTRKIMMYWSFRFSATSRGTDTVFPGGWWWGTGGWELQEKGLGDTLQDRPQGLFTNRNCI